MRYFDFENYQSYCNMTNQKSSDYKTLKSFKELCKAIDNL